MANPSFVLRAVKDVVFEERPKPQIRDQHDVIVHVAQTGICGSDVHYWQRGRIGEFVLTSPIVLGHESSGVVAEVGELVKGLKPGDRVAMEPGVPCRRCDLCRSGAYYLCEDMVFAATPPYDGTLAKYYLSAADYCYKIPDTMSMEEAAMVEPVSVAVAVVKNAELCGGQSVLVLGCGPIGVLTQRVAQAYGAKKVVGVDVVQSRLDFARSYGADAVIKPNKPAEGVDPIEHAEKTAKEICTQNGLKDGFDVVLECSGAEPCVQMGIFATKRAGIFVQAGMGKEAITFPISALITRGITARGSLRYLPGCYPAAIDLISSGKIDVKPLITNRFKFEEAEQAFDLVKAGKEGVFKVMIAGVA